MLEGKNHWSGKEFWIPVKWSVLRIFSKVEEPGTYYVEIPGVGRSVDFKISKDIYNFPFYTVMRGMYLWRCGCTVSGTHNGVAYAHEACHLDDAWMDFATGEKIKKEGLKRLA